MIKNIEIYEMPKEGSERAFQIYEVEGIVYKNQSYPHQTKQPHRHKYYEICVFVNGAGKHEIDFKTHSIKPNSIHFLTPGQVHLISREENYHGYLIVFTREFYFFDQYKKQILLDFPFFNNNSETPILNLSEEEFTEFLNIIGNIKKEYVRKSDDAEPILRSYLNIFLLKCKTYFNKYNVDQKAIADPEYNTVSEFRNLVEKHFQTYHMVQQYADIMALTPVNLNKVVKKITGMNASEIIINRLVLEAKRLLIYTDLAGKEIAYRMNYEDPSYFSRIFRKKTGVSPSEFREQMMKKYD